MAHNTTTKTSTRSDGPCFMDPLLQRVPTQSHLQPAHAAPLPGKVRTPGPTNRFCSPVLKINAQALPPARLPQTSPAASSASPPAKPALCQRLECCPPRLQRAPAAASAGTRRLQARAPPSGRVGVPTRGLGSQLVNAACFLILDDDARGNTVTHSLSWFRPRGRTSSKGGVRGHCIILHPECL